jgi:hypothetical protein
MNVNRRSIVSKVTLAVAAVWAAAAPAFAQPAANDWPALLEADARAYHAEQAANHPGPYNRRDPDFRQRLDKALAAALQRARSVSTPGGYMFALREMVASFNDGHMYIGFNDKLDVPGKWPGFVATYADNAFSVRHVSPEMAAAGLAVGDRILACEGRNPEALLAELVAPWRGGWMLEANRQRQGWRAFHDLGNPWVKRPASCRIESGGTSREFGLSWTAQPSDFPTIVTAANANARAPIALRDFSGGTWISAGSFHAGEGTAAEKALPALVASIAERQAAVRNAPIVVLDLRGNSGGSSDWGAQMARLLWGDTAVDRVSDALGKGVHVDWRATRDNFAAIDEFCGPMMENTQGASPEAVAWCRKNIAGLQSAIEAGQPLWRAPDEPATTPGRRGPGFESRRKPTYLLTDSACGSACLDTVDLWMALGAIPVGRTTNADSDYMEVRDKALPSGLGEFSVPMKVYSGRQRGSGVPVEPVHRFTGDMSDTAALERWISGLQTLSGAPTRRRAETIATLPVGRFRGPGRGRALRRSSGGLLRRQWRGGRWASGFSDPMRPGGACRDRFGRR